MERSPYPLEYGNSGIVGEYLSFLFFWGAMQDQVMFQFSSRIQAQSLQQNKLDHDKNFKSS